MQAITFPSDFSAEKMPETLLELAWNLLKHHQLTVDSFVEMITLNAPNNGGAALFHDAIRRSLTDEAIRLARALAEQGLQQYPNDPQLLKYQKGLAPPKILETGKHAGRDYSKSMRWLSAHSHEYVGQWVALRDGELMGTAPSRDEIIRMIGDAHKEPNVLVSRIPRT